MSPALAVPCAHSRPRPSSAQNTRIIVPQAPKVSVTCLPQEADQHAWFDVLEEKMDAAREAAGDQAQEDDVGIEEVRRESTAHDARHASLAAQPSRRSCAT